MGDLFGYEGLGNVGGVCVAADSLPPDGQREEDGAFSG